MSVRVSILSSCVAMLAVAGAHHGISAEPTAAPKREWAAKVDKPGLKNLHRVTDRLYRGAQPTEVGMRELEAIGIKTVISLRAFNSDKDEIAATRLKTERISFKTWHPEDSDVIRFLKLVSDSGNEPIFVHCLHGSDRTGTMIAIYRIALQGWSKDEAIEEMTKGDFGYHEMWTNLIKYLRELDVAKIKREARIK